MVFQVFPTRNYVLNSTYTPPEVIAILSENILHSNGVKSATEKKDIQSRYFEGAINKYNSLKFTVRYNDKMFSSALNKNAKLSPINNGVIAAVKDGSSINITATPPQVVYIYLIGFLLFPVLLFTSGFPIIVEAFFFIFFIVLIVSIRSKYVRILTNDKEKLQHIFKANQV